MKIYVVVYSYEDQFEEDSVKDIFENVFSSKDKAIDYMRNYADNSVPAGEFDNWALEEIYHWNYDYTELEFPGWSGTQKLTIIEKEL